ncbi:MAG: non-canonical purine NTP pyrophosphatase, RdgB/HAM1 family [Ignavibacteria bacterium RIFOXYB2_FULL_35_12]|nr:MAG: non-canonical purine NTP pyrophosphatase, RdgB/HAM1 family [Ignavibacteria bacterium GWA2_36_19]OGU51844.1 MAG: non-canonical purine NTP pyrophosphatase, RdgB/HAM1 family [Ignavibacteria bacterium GWC2_35_8]OGU56228.1 MAG: non-canonical purine NTP pyrophosphatase, RdgB/HAM1 family [Ignavibacteria bacterium GWF2_35_20]OGU83361.1 MAG: non-canonical purine NTP pyrophosphatase, RdgB/HAM1 family [Ignavibacteria bacterium RIFOXYA2_FULL_35_9]OGU86739.1 MAG: non-canonical purine NTP pyrophospha
MKHKIIFATKNYGKLKEVCHILGEKEIELLSLNDFNNVAEIVEDGNTFEENAVKKAKYVFEKYSIPVLADDSGLVVEQLNGEPGIYSARYAGENATDEENNKKLISRLLSLPQPHKAKFVCSAVYFDGKNMMKAEGEIVGQIIHEQHGKNGFGYDPLFMPDGYNQTTAELNFDEKNKISHRAKAFNSLLKLIKERG